ncbi:ester cyclase [soil metagenome]
MTTTAQDMIEIQTRWAEEVINQGRLDVLDEILSPDIVDHDPAPDQKPGPEGFKGFFATMRSAFPDLQVTGETMVADGDLLAVAYRMDGTHQGEFLGLAPTGRKVSFRGLQIARFAGGKAVERWGSSDQLGMFQQLGVENLPG